jgi:hypothetical protein
MLVRMAAIFYMVEQNEPSYPFCLELEAEDKPSLSVALEEWAHAELSKEDPDAGYERENTQIVESSDYGDIQIERADELYLFVTVHAEDREAMGLTVD